MEFIFFNKFKKEGSKRYDSLDYITWDEILAVAIGITVFGWFQKYDIYFILGVISWYWLKTRHLERKVISKQNDICNVNNKVRKETEGLPVNEAAAQRIAEIKRRPMEEDLKQLEYKRKIFVEKFVLINLILMVLIQLFVKNI